MDHVILSEPITMASRVEAADWPSLNHVTSLYLRGKVKCIPTTDIKNGALAVIPPGSIQTRVGGEGRMCSVKAQGLWLK